MVELTYSSRIAQTTFEHVDSTLEIITMDRDTFDGALRTLKHRAPFRPFTVAMVNGDRLEVDFPDALAYRDGVALYVAPGGIPVLFDHEGVSQLVGDIADASA